MRHVILGMNTILGTSILRVIISLTEHPIIACGEDSTLPEGIPEGRIRTIAINPENPIELMEILNPDDVVYFCDIINDENTLNKSLMHRNRIYFSNLLYYANEREVKKIIAYLPQSTGWTIPLNAVEDSIQKNSSIYHKSLLEIENLCKLYWAGDVYFQEKVSADDEMMIDFSDADLLASFEDEFGNTDFNLDPFGSSDEKENDTISPDQTGPSTEDLTNSPSDSSPSPDEKENETISPDQTGPSTEDLIISPSDSSPSPDDPMSSIDEDPTLIESEEGDDEIPENEPKNGIADESDLELKIEPKQKNTVPLVLARIARFFGPSEPDLTEWFCHSVRLRRIVLIGKSNAKISWINPIDAARAMIILADQKVTNEQFNVSGFNASAIEILAALDKVNGSNIKVKTKLYGLRIIKLKLKQGLAKLGIGNSIPYFKYYSLNKPQLFSDQKAQKVWKWKPRFGLSATAEESMKWFINYVLSSKKVSN